MNGGYTETGYKDVFMDLYCVIVDDVNLGHSCLRCVLAGSRTLRSHGGRGKSGRRRGTTFCTGRHTCQLCILGENGIKSERRHTLHPAHFCGALTTLTVLTGDSPVTRSTHTCSGFPQARVAVGAMLEAGVITVGPPQALRARLAAARALWG